MTQEQKQNVKRNAELDAAFQLWWFYSPKGLNLRDDGVLGWAQREHKLSHSNLAVAFETATLGALDQARVPG